MSDDYFGVEFTGLDDLMAELRELPDAMQKRIMKGTVATAASVIRKAAIAKAPMSSIGEKAKLMEQMYPPGTLKKSIYQTRLTELCAATTEAWKVDVRIGNKTTKKGARNAGAFYAHWVEFGHYVRPKGGGKHPRKDDRRKQSLAGAKFVPGSHYMRNAFNESKGAALDAAREYMADRIIAGDLALKILKAF